MKKILIALCTFLVVSCGISRRSEENYIMIHEEEQAENYTNQQLRNWLKKNDSPRIVVRGRGSGASITSSSGSDKMCALLESALAKNGFDVRDRYIFENVANSLGNEKRSSYKELSDATDVDLLMEITSYSLSDYYYVDGYYKNRKEFEKFDTIERGEGKNTWEYQPVYTFRGMSLTIKVIMLKDNLLGGSYSYSYVPCSAKTGGALITNMYPLRYIPNGESRDLDAIADDDNGRSLMESRSTRMDRAMENFISNTVVPSIIRDIRGDDTYSRSSYSSARTEVRDDNLSISRDMPDERNYNSSIPPARTSESNIAQNTAPVNTQRTDNSSTTVESLMVRYGVEGYLREFQNAVTAKDRKRAKQIEDQLWEIEGKVKDDPSIPQDIKSQFVKTIEDAEDSIEDKPKGFDVILNLFKKDKKKDDGQVSSPQADVSTPESLKKTEPQPVIAVNTFGKLSSAVQDWIQSAFENKSQAYLSSIKKEKDLTAARGTINSILTDYDQLEYLVSSKADLSDLIAFIAISCSNVGENYSPADDTISIFLPTSSKTANNDTVCLVFIDKECVGVGSYLKGIYTGVPLNKYDDKFHRISIVGLDSNAKRSELHNSSVRFDIKKDYLFSRDGAQLIVN